MSLNANALASLIIAGQPQSPQQLYSIEKSYIESNATITSIGVSATISITGNLSSTWDGDAKNDVNGCLEGNSTNLITITMPSPAPPQFDTWNCVNITSFPFLPANLSNIQYVTNFCQQIINGIINGSSGSGKVLTIT